MSSTPTRSAIVDALDELGEREHISSAWVEAGTEPYPPSVVKERVEESRRGQWTAWGGIGLTGFIVLLATPGVLLSWGGMSPLAGALPGLLVVGWVSIQKLLYLGKAEQLYALLHNQESETEPKVVSESPPVEVA